VSETRGAYRLPFLDRCNGKTYVTLEREAFALMFDRYRLCSVRVPSFPFHFLCDPMRTIHQIPRERASEFLTNETQGRFFSAFFYKKDLTLREMVCRRGVKKDLAGGSLGYDAASMGLLPVYDMQVRSGNARRMVNLNTLVSFNVGGETFIIV
jgi:hypothetical protein